MRTACTFVHAVWHIASVEYAQALGISIEEIEQGLAKSAAIAAEIIRGRPKWDETTPDAEALAVAAGKIKRSFIAEVEKAEAMWETTQSAFSAAKDQRAGLGERLDGAKNRRETAKLRLSELTSDGKADEERQTTLKKVIMAWDAAKTGLEEIERKLVEFEDDPTETVAQLEKQILAADEAATKALEDEKTEEGQLGRLSAEGPYSALARAEEEVVRLEQELAREELRTAAVRLLRNVVDQCRAEALTAVAGPVEATATRTLQRIAGGRLGRLQLGESFEPVQILPDVTETSVSIENLSGGEKEQIYLAVRLALAEVLAGEERQLVVLDDVLLATDPGRLARIMTVLEEAAQHLQVLIMTCHPERYRGLEGASFVDLVAILRESWNE
ncbi:MAG: hypothetical protein KAY24_16220 [Candidatus Eisenbacteria sp.]|nr:hypothetical protein [Candidatus Eisenbacteria bacterium]